MDSTQLQDLMPIILPLIILNLILLVIALRDLIKRPASRVKGSKAMWAVVIVVVNTIGPIVYLVAGRKD